MNEEREKPSVGPLGDMVRDECRALQDRWLAIPSVRSHVQMHGWHERILPGTDTPTFEDVRTMVLPKWKSWFEDFWK